jgi:hypothetical protein
MRFAATPLMAAEARKPYTLMVYMNGSDLEANRGCAGQGCASFNLRQMMAVGSSAAANVVVETGGTLKWHNDFVGPKETQRWYIEKHSMRRVDDGSLGLRSMADPNPLADFVAWTVSNYPAERYALVFWDHGGGTIGGFGSDQNFGVCDGGGQAGASCAPRDPADPCLAAGGRCKTGECEGGDQDGASCAPGDQPDPCRAAGGIRCGGVHPSLGLAKLDAALAAAKARTGATLELIGFDACLLGTLEFAATLKAYARYMVASEELEPGQGWDYTVALKTLEEDPQTDGKRWGTAIVDSYMTQNREEQGLTLSVTDLGQVDALLTSLGDVAASVAPAVDTQWPRLSKARDEAERFGRSPVPGGETDMVDVGDWIGKMQKRGLITVEQATPALDAVGQAVVYKRSDQFRSDAQGLSVYFPDRAKENFADSLAFYRQLGFVPAYTALIDAYATRMLNYDDAPRLVNAELRPAASGGQHFEIAVDKDDVEKVRQANAFLGERKLDNEVRMLEEDDMVSFDENSGVIGYQFDRKWPMIDNAFACLISSDQNGPIVTYDIPVRIKYRGKVQDAYLNAKYDTRSGRFGKVRTGQWVVQGDFAPVSKREFRLKPGQRIKLLLREMREGSQQPAFVESKVLKVRGKSLSLRNTAAPPGDYVIGFNVEGVSGKDTMSEVLPYAYLPPEAVTATKTRR